MFPRFLRLDETRKGKEEVIKQKSQTREQISQGLGGFPAKTKNANDQIQVSDQTPAPGSLASGVILGTSFSNIRKLQEMRPQLMEMKKQKQ